MDNYYKDTYKANNRAFNVIGFNDYKKRMIADNPDAEKLPIWDWVQPNNCYSNALFICDMNGLLECYDEWCNYCEGIIINRISLMRGEAVAVHHSWIYSTKYECYVDCTPITGDAPNMYLYLLSDELKDDELQNYLENLCDDEGNTNPRFIHNDLPFGMKVNKDW